MCSDTKSSSTRSYLWVAVLLHEQLVNLQLILPEIYSTMHSQLADCLSSLPAQSTADICDQLPSVFVCSLRQALRHINCVVPANNKHTTLLTHDTGLDVNMVPVFKKVSDTVVVTALKTELVLLLRLCQQLPRLQEQDTCLQMYCAIAQDGYNAAKAQRCTTSHTQAMSETQATAGTRTSKAVHGNSVHDVLGNLATLWQHCSIAFITDHAFCHQHLKAPNHIKGQDSLRPLLLQPAVQRLG